MRWLSILAVVFAISAHAEDIKVLAGSAMDEPLGVLIPQFERASRHKVVMDSNGAIGAMAKRVEAGEPADVLIASAAQLAALEKSGKVLAGKAREAARAFVGFITTPAAAPVFKAKGFE